MLGEDMSVNNTVPSGRGCVKVCTQTFQLLEEAIRCSLIDARNIHRPVCQLGSLST